MKTVSVSLIEERCLSFRRFHNLVTVLDAKMFLNIHVATKIRMSVF